MDFNFDQKVPKPDKLSQCHKLIEDLWQQCKQKKSVIALLEEKIQTNSNNSSLPPSVESLQSKAERKKNHQKKQMDTNNKKNQRGGQKGHKGTGRKLLPSSVMDEIIRCNPPEICPDCGKEIKLGQLKKRKQVFDLPIGKLWTTEYQLYGGHCRGCKKRYCGQLPLGVPTGILGTEALTHIGTLTSKYRLSKREAREFLIDFFSLVISLGTISYAEEKISSALELPVEEVRKTVCKVPFMHVDETGFTKNWVNQWLWVAVTANFTYFKLFHHRNQESAKQLIGEEYKGAVISDRYVAYQWLSIKQRQYCWSHLKRDFKKISEKENVKERKIGRLLLNIFQSIFLHYRRIRDGTAHRGTQSLLVKAMVRLYQALEQGQMITRTRTGSFCKKLIGQRQALWLFLRNKEIEPTNNRAERALRHGVLWRKKCFGTQSERGNRFVERSLTVLMSCRQQHRSVIDFISQCVQASLGTGSYPSLVGAIQTNKECSSESL